MSNIAVIETGGKQYKVKEGSVIKIEKIKGKEGEKVVFDNVLLISDKKGDKLEIGKPYLKDKKIEGEIIEQARDKKVMVVKYKRKTRYKVRQGHRQHYTKVKIIKV